MRESFKYFKHMIYGMVPPILKPEERELYLVRDEEIREKIAAYIVNNLEVLVVLASRKGISSPNLADKWRILYKAIVEENNQRDYSKVLKDTLNAHSAGLIDKFAEMFEDSYRHEPDLSFIRKKGKLPKDDEYYPTGLEMELRAA